MHLRVTECGPLKTGGSVSCMKAKNFLFVSIAVAAFAITSTAQSVVVTGKKQVYTRPKPLIDFKRTFSIRRPIVKASTPVLSKKITAMIDPTRVLGIDLKEEIGEIQWLSEADFKVVYNERGMLTVMVWMEGSGAYPDGVTKYVVLDATKGAVQTPK